MSLKENLIESGKTRWLDVGCGGNFEQGFTYLDIIEPEKVPEEFRTRYVHYDIAGDNAPKNIGVFDLIRLQHSFEHFTFEDGQRVLENCAGLLDSGGIILITVPDLRIHVDMYLTKGYFAWEGYKNWALTRIPPSAPASFFFSIFAYSMPFESHNWCYDVEGLFYQLVHSGEYEEIEELPTDHRLANVPFTHNRPEEDLCVIAKRRTR